MTKAGRESLPAGFCVDGIQLLISANLAIVLLAMNAPAGKRLPLADNAALALADMAVRAGHPYVTADKRLLPLQAAGFGPGELPVALALVDPGFLLCSGPTNDRGAALGIGGAG